MPPPASIWLELAGLIKTDGKPCLNCMLKYYLRQTRLLR